MATVEQARSTGSAPRGPKAGGGAPGARDGGRRGRRRRARRAAALWLLTMVAGAAAWLVLDPTGGADYRIHVRFANAGQLVSGGRVEVAGVPVGRIERISIAPDGRADIELGISDRRFVPLRLGTRASIRAVGQATITNRFVDLGPGPSNAPALADGDVLRPQDSNGIVDLDAILSSLDAPFRRQLQRLIGRGAELYAGSNGPTFNRVLAQLDPALAAVGGLAGDLRSDQSAIAELVRTGAIAARAVASRRSDLERAVDHTATTFRAVADERGALTDALDRAPRVLDQAGGTLRSAARTAQTLRPTLRAVPAPQRQLRLLLRRLPKVLKRTEPVGAQLDGLLQPLQTALRGVPPLEAPTVEGVRALSSGLRRAMPMLEGFRFYGSDLVLGLVNGLISVGTGQYNGNGHYLKIEFVQNPQTLIGGALSGAIPAITKLLGGLLPGVINVATRQDARCPGGNAPPAPDGSNPWYPKKGICDPTMSMSALVNSPTALCRKHSDCEGDPRRLEPDPDGTRPGLNLGRDR